MRTKATHVYTDILPPLTCSHDERPPLAITPAGRLALVPSMDELLSRRGAKGLQITLEELTHHHFMKHGHDWRYAGAKIVTNHAKYFVRGDFQGDMHYLGTYRQGLGFLIAYAKTGAPNDALRRAR